MLDTNALAFVLVGHGLTDAASKALWESDDVFISAITVFEITTKVRIGKWPELAEVVPAIFDLLDDAAIRYQAVDHLDMYYAGTSQWDHRDPFDRIIVARAGRDRTPLLSSDRAIKKYALDSGEFEVIW